MLFFCVVGVVGVVGGGVLVGVVGVLVSCC